MPTLDILRAGTPIPLAERWGSAYVLEIEDDVIMIDCGPAATAQLVEMGRKPEDVTHLFFTRNAGKTCRTVSLRLQGQPGRQLCGIKRQRIAVHVMGFDVIFVCFSGSGLSYRFRSKPWLVIDVGYLQGKGLLYRCINVSIA